MSKRARVVDDRRNNPKNLISEIQLLNHDFLVNTELTEGKSVLSRALDRVMRCKSCRKQCEPFNSLNAFCDADCAISYLNGNTGRKLIEKVKRKKFREKKKEVKGLSHWNRVTQTVVNKYVRLRDRNLPCISCGKWDHELKEAVRKGKWDAGHYKTVGGHRELRFNTKKISTNSA